MIALCGTQILWTFAVEDVFRRVAAGNKHAMKKELAQENIDLNNLIDCPSQIEYLLVPQKVCQHSDYY